MNNISALEEISLVYDKDGRFFQWWASNYKGDGAAHAETIAKQIGGRCIHTKDWVPKDE